LTRASISPLLDGRRIKPGDDGSGHTIAGSLASMSDRRPKIEIRGLRKAFGEKRVLNGLDLEVGVGESVVVIGGSGSGKSVTLKCVLGLIHPDGGSIKIDGEEAVGLRGAERERVLRKFGMLFQGSALFDSLRVWENVAFGLVQGRGVARVEAKDVAMRKLGAVGLGPEVGELWPAELSGGMQKRVALARAIATEPEIIFFDEPTTGLDPIMADVINQLVRKCVGELGATALSITHDMASARKIGDRIAMIHDGRIIWSGGVREIDASGNEFVDQFIHGRGDGPIKMPVRPL
jgi:phospholipid/cholesterol/gamma-HCH transport system ATP-binding protein